MTPSHRVLYLVSRGVNHMDEVANVLDLDQRIMQTLISRGFLHRLGTCHLCITIPGQSRLEEYNRECPVLGEIDED